jgi:hypothetical protein
MFKRFGVGLSAAKGPSANNVLPPGIFRFSRTIIFGAFFSSRDCCGQSSTGADHYNVSQNSRQKFFLMSPLFVFSLINTKDDTHRIALSRQVFPIATKIVLTFGEIRNDNKVSSMNYSFTVIWWLASDTPFGSKAFLILLSQV